MKNEFFLLGIGQSFVEGLFIKRQNRFVIECQINGENEFAHLPNPGRLWELLLPNTRLLLVKNFNHNRKYYYTCYGVFKNDEPVLLHTSRNNDIVEWILDSNLFSPLKGYKIISREVNIHNSRIDFLLGNSKEEIFIEVKSCTLFHKTLAMFPDAVTERGTRHLIELAKLKNQKRHGGILIIVHSGNVKYFLPEYHTDLKFAKTLYDLRNELKVFATGVQWSKNLTLNSMDLKPLVIPFSIISNQAVDTGAYILIITNKNDQEIEIGNLGKIKFQKGFYCYVGSAMKNLQQRISRHRRFRKNFHWHIDYLIEKTSLLNTIVIRTTDRIECKLASDLKKISETFIDKFGSSDCNCVSHLFFFNENPLSMKNFIDLILFYRMERLIEKYNLK